ncbi:TPA: hypothetical protein DIV55_04545 [Patescibacteria group bacterium]|uniref:Uncharacterized protein n=1 Tax=Candidatus Curtissbacteria bacterium GW2011_GWA1_41_11 TaxID=1618409 RepID=A0A0G0XJU4_9BACT|nr:MAG: hypothetical protein UU34_C0002G0064 [Candidatus Curtissbacteria bacterium GW2011_GWA1_41_11]HCS78983.1 hypothetical protein [Patescibacteria group bacterium]
MKKGLSLLELQIVIAIFGGISLITGAVYFAYTRLINEEKITIEVANQNRNAIDEMTNQIREAQSVAMDCTICGTVSDSSSTVLILALWPIDTNGNLFQPATGEYDYMVYKLDSAPNDTNLIKQIIPNGTTSSRINTSKILSSDVKTILFEYGNASPALASEVTVSLTNEKISFVKTHTYSQQSKASLRNK